MLYQAAARINTQAHPYKKPPRAAKDATQNNISLHQGRWATGSAALKSQASGLHGSSQCCQQRSVTCYELVHFGHELCCL